MTRAADHAANAQADHGFEKCATASQHRPGIAVADFLDVFGGPMDEGAAFTDVTGSTLAITKTLFQNDAGEFKWLSKPDKTTRLEYINLLAMTRIEPDEIWLVWVNGYDDKGRWRLKRRYLRAFEVEGTNKFGITVFEWGKNRLDRLHRLHGNPENRGRLRSIL